MNRPDLLSETEQKLVDAHRTAIEAAKQQRTSAVWGDLHRELENIYLDLQDIRPDLWEETVREACSRLYNLLY